MKNNPLALTLVVVLATSSLAAAYLSWLYMDKVGQYNGVQTTLQKSMNQDKDMGVVATALVSDALEYGKKNPAIYPVLQSLGIGPDGKPVQPTSQAPTLSVRPGGK